jgi:hypothetical protein
MALEFGIVKVGKSEWLFAKFTPLVANGRKRRGRVAIDDSGAQSIRDEENDVVRLLRHAGRCA